MYMVKMAGIEKAKSNATDLFHSHGKMDNEEVVDDHHVVSIPKVWKIGIKHLCSIQYCII